MAVLPTHKYSLNYIEHCRIVMADERLAYIKAENAVDKHFSLPYANSNLLLLGPGTSITHQAARLLGDEGVCLAFCGGGGTPLYMTSVNEYRPTEYMQKWCQFWYSDSARLAVAKKFQNIRIDLIKKSLASSEGLESLSALLDNYRSEVILASDNGALLLTEARFSKKLYGMLAKKAKLEFTRTPKGGDPLNEMLDAGNYMAYGFAACALWVLGISYAFGINHGMTRRGALVFDVADLVKDALVMPQAFEGIIQGDSPSQNRNRILVSLENGNALKLMLESIIEGLNTGLSDLSLK